MDKSARPATSAGRDGIFPAPAGGFSVTETFPDRLSVDPASKYHDAKLLERNIGIRFNGAERTNVEEYCISEGWIRVSVGTTVDRKGNPMTLKLKGKVEAFIEPKNGKTE